MSLTDEIVASQGLTVHELFGGVSSCHVRTWQSCMRWMLIGVNHCILLGAFRHEALQCRLVGIFDHFGTDSTSVSVFVILGSAEG